MPGNWSNRIGLGGGWFRFSGMAGAAEWSMAGQCRRFQIAARRPLVLRNVRTTGLSKQYRVCRTGYLMPLSQYLLLTIHRMEQTVAFSSNVPSSYQVLCRYPVPCTPSS